MKHKYQTGNKLEQFKPKLKRAAIFIPKDFNLSSYVRYVIEPSKSTKKYKKLKDWLNQADFNSKQVDDIRRSVQNAYIERTKKLTGGQGSKEYVMLDFTLTPKQEKQGIQALDVKQTMGKSVLHQLFNLDKPIGFMEEIGKKMQKKEAEPLTGVTIDEGEVGGDTGISSDGGEEEGPALNDMGSPEGGEGDYRKGGSLNKTKYKQGGNMDYMKAYRVSRILNKFATQRNKDILERFARGGKLKATAIQKNRKKLELKEKETKVLQNSLNGGLLLR